MSTLEHTYRIHHSNESEYLEINRSDNWELELTYRINGELESRMVLPEDFIPKLREALATYE